MGSIKVTMPERMETDKKIQILLSTFNGERFLHEQLDSFLCQKCHCNTSILIRDDGSTDGTWNILKKYRDKYGFKIVKGKNIGVNRSIYELFNLSDKSCDYYALSDQDDVWLPNKLSMALQSLQSSSERRPMLFASCSQVVTETLEPLGKTIIPKKGVGFYNAMAQNVTPGHTQVFNRKLMECLKLGRSDDIHVVDWWIYLIASGMGQVIFNNECTVLHRQHGDNAVGYELSFLKQLFKRLKRIHTRDANTISRQLKSFYNIYGNNLNPEYHMEIQAYLDNLTTLPKRLSYAVKTKIYRQTEIETLLFKCLYIMGKYNLG